MSVGRRELAAQRRTYPLRRVVDHNATQSFRGSTVPAVELECGHKLAPPEDRSGRRYPERMRCRFCASSTALRASSKEVGGRLFVTEDEAKNERRYRCSICGARFMAPLDDVPRPAKHECDGCNRMLPTVSEEVGGDGE
jgi:hypothetical protein